MASILLWKTAHAVEQQSLCTTPTEAHAPQSLCSAIRTPCMATKSSSHSPQLEKACMQWPRPSTVKIKQYIFFFLQQQQESVGRMDTCIWIPETLCCSPETITLFVNRLYPNTKKKKKKKKTQNTAEYSFFPNAYVMFSGTDHMLGHKLSLGKFKTTEIISSISSNHNATRLEINYKKENYKKKYKQVYAKQYGTKPPMDHWRNQRGNQKLARYKWKWKHNDQKPMERSKSSSRSEVQSNAILPQETRKISNSLNLHLKQIQKEQTKSKVSGRKEIIKIRAEINEKWRKQ